MEETVRLMHIMLRKLKIQKEEIRQLNERMDTAEKRIGGLEQSFLEMKEKVETKLLFM